MRTRRDRKKPDPIPAPVPDDAPCLECDGTGYDEDAGPCPHCDGSGVAG